MQWSRVEFATKIWVEISISIAETLLAISKSVKNALKRTVKVKRQKEKGERKKLILVMLKFNMLY